MHARSSFSRRGFLSRALLAAPFFASKPVWSVPPVARIKSPHLRLSMAIYSFRDFLTDHHTGQPGPQASSQPMSIEALIDFCAVNGCDGIELTSYYLPRDPSTEYLAGLRKRAFVNGMTVSGSAVGNRFTLPRGKDRDAMVAGVKRWTDHTAALGGSHLRVFAGERGGMELADARRACVECLEECCDYAGGKGVFLGLENHGGIVADADGLLEIVSAVKSPWLGVNLDTGNFHTVDPYADLVRCAPYAVNVQIKSEIQPKGKPKQLADLPRLVGILRDSGYRGFVALEYEAAEDPRTAVPRLLGEIRRLLTA